VIATFASSGHALSGCDPQIKGHVAANLNFGNDRALLLAVATQLPFIGYPRTLNALAAVNEISPPHTAQPPGHDTKEN